MITEMKNFASPMLPLVIREATYADGALSIVGDGWALSTISAWRFVQDGLVVCGWSDDFAPDFLSRLAGGSVVSISTQSSLMPGDPVFEFANDVSLEIFSDAAIDPWSLILPGMTFVGSPTDIDCVDRSD